jgi:DNA-binding response OmpR family regulator
MTEVLPQPSPGRPLTGITILAVEDSRLASEALRLMCLRSGARLRRADCLETARRHLAVYRPTVAIVDIGLPDGSGCDLILALAQARPRVSLVLGSSGETGLGPLALRAGADGFLEKPIKSLRAFQICLTQGLQRSPSLVVRDGPAISPDPLALRDDLHHAMRLLGDGGATPPRAYLAQFLRGVARCSHDEVLARAAKALEPSDDEADLASLRHCVAARLAAASHL